MASHIYVWTLSNAWIKKKLKMLPCLHFQTDRDKDGV